MILWVFVVLLGPLQAGDLGAVPTTDSTSPRTRTGRTLLRSPLPLRRCHGSVIVCRSCLLQGISKTKKRKPNPYLYQSVAVLAAEMGLTESARDWFQRGTSTFSVGSRQHLLPDDTEHALSTFTDSSIL